MKPKYFICAVFMALFQIVAFIAIAIPFATLKDMYEWKCIKVGKVLKFNVIAAYHTILSDWDEWKK